MERYYKIGEAISILQEEYPDLSASTLRFWEREGLVKPSERTIGDQRLYSDENLNLIRYIKELSLADYSIEKIKEKIKEAREEVKESKELKERVGKVKKGTLKEFVKREASLPPGVIINQIKENFKSQRTENKLRQDLSLLEGLSEKEKWERVYTKESLAKLLNINEVFEFINKAEKLKLIRPRVVEGKKRYTPVDEVILKILIFSAQFWTLKSDFLDKRCSHLASSIEYLYDFPMIEDFPADFEDADGYAFHSYLYNLIRDNATNKVLELREEKEARSKSKKANAKS